MTWPTRICSVLVLILLPGCFLSATSHIQSGVHLASGNVLLCPKDDPECQTAYVEGDGYILYAPDPEEEDLRLRFEVLASAPPAGTIYIGEAELRDGSETAWAYVIARAAHDRTADTPAFDLVMPDCRDAGEAGAAGGGFHRTDAYSCEVSDYPAFKAYLIRVYGPRFANPGFWRTSSPAPTP